MSVRSISLRKLIKILFLPANRRVSAIRDDIREEIKRNQGSTEVEGISMLPFGVMPKTMYLAFRISTRQWLTGLPQMINAEIYTHVYVMVFFCGGMSGGVGQMNHSVRHSSCGRGFRFLVSMRS